MVCNSVIFLFIQLSASFFFFSFIFISWRLITLQYCSGFCHTLTWISHGFTSIPHPDPPSHFPQVSCICRCSVIRFGKYLSHYFLKIFSAPAFWASNYTYTTLLPNVPWLTESLGLRKNFFFFFLSLSFASIWIISISVSSSLWIFHLKSSNLLFIPSS